MKRCKDKVMVIDNHEYVSPKEKERMARNIITQIYEENSKLSKPFFTNETIHSMDKLARIMYVRPRFPEWRFYKYSSVTPQHYEQQPEEVPFMHFDFNKQHERYQPERELNEQVSISITKQSNEPRESPTANDSDSTTKPKYKPEPRQLPTGGITHSSTEQQVQPKKISTRRVNTSNTKLSAKTNYAEEFKQKIETDESFLDNVLKILKSIVIVPFTAIKKLFGF
ncbi:hypothetical protein DPMN_137949 [Dreissena polymorpha]|uniref:Uncharacterized protein n=1 Tax=Dreissena polymorpha TaxID=45954 RepID=A0A9D4G673_DREPO|nr:hypothetical protein DPMN_137949 [Dreissena polymorpha]